MITEKEILELIDGSIKGQQADGLLQKINSDKKLNNVYQSLLKTHNMLGDQPLKAPSSSFNQKVMDNLSKRVDVATANGFWKKNLFFALTVVAIGFTAAIILLSSYSLGEVIPLDNAQEFTIQDKTIYFNPGKLFNQDLFFKGLIYLNAFLGIFLLERAVLRPFFTQRRKNLSF